MKIAREGLRPIAGKQKGICQKLAKVIMEPINVKADQVSAVQALRMFEGGRHLRCPVCDSILDSIPAGVAPGTGRISGLACPISNMHFLIYGDDADAMKGVRERMRRIAGKL